MFEIGDYVVFGTDGVCRVEKIGSLEMEGISNDRVYYTLAPFEKPTKNKIFAPVDGKKVVMRKVMTQEEALDLMGSVSKIARVTIADERKREESYKAILQSCDCVEIVGLIKELYTRKQERLAMGKKLPAVDERYFAMAENSLISELCLPLNRDKESVRAYIAEECIKGISAE